VGREAFLPVVADFVIVGIEDDGVRNAMFAIERRIEFEVLDFRASADDFYHGFREQGDRFI
jgi:hypothetical protein